MRLIRSRLLIAAVAVLLASVIAKSQTADPAPSPEHDHPWGMSHRGHMGFFAKYLNLSDAQKQQMKAVLQKEHATMKPLTEQLHQSEAQLRQYEQGAYDEAKVRALAAQESQAQIELTVQRTRIHSELFQLLTPEQQTKMKEFEAHREARWQKHMHSPDQAPTEQQ